VHAIEDCDFNHILDTCPRDLVEAGLFQEIAIELRSGRYEAVSAGLLAKAMADKNTLHAHISTHTRMLTHVCSHLLFPGAGRKGVPSAVAEVPQVKPPRASPPGLLRTPALITSDTRFHPDHSTPPLSLT